ncbi:MAG: proline dehydrogenase family protein [Planctomycetes bacterium]|nr:proline dehydrogenase family protein [Planctomycetota bacterium]
MNLFDRFAAACLPLVPRFIVRRLSTRYIAGEQMDQALTVGKNLQQAGYRVTYDILGEAVDHREGVTAAAEEYHRLLEALVEQNLELNISLKPTQMGLNISEGFCFETIAKIAEKAKKQGAFMRYEMEDSNTTDATLRVFQQLRSSFGDTIGCVVQSMLRRTVQDCKDLVASDLPLNVRLVKGIYVEPEAIAYQSSNDVNTAYLDSLRVLLEGGAFVGLATHDPALILGAREIIQSIPGSEDRVEVQMLLGVQENLRNELKMSGMPVRVYIPYGTQWYPYVTRRLKKNPRLARYAMMGLFAPKEKLAPLSGQSSEE